MSESTKNADVFAESIAQWTKLWQSAAETSTELGETWSKSMLPFIMARAAEKRSGGSVGDEFGEAIERLAHGPRMSDIWDIDSKLLSAFTAWSRMRQKLAAYNAVSARPWMRAMERYGNAASAESGAERQPDWREAFAGWNGIANEELIHNQRSDEFMQVQRELLQASIEFRRSQTELNKTVADIFGLPTQGDFDDVTRQLTELRREVRALARRLGPDDAPPPPKSGKPVKRAKDSVA